MAKDATESVKLKPMCWPGSLPGSPTILDYMRIYLSVSSDYVIRWRKNLKANMVASMGGKCQICGYDKCHEALELHHINPKEKEISFGQIRANPVSQEKVIVELQKCILLCSNCHKEVHAGIVSLPDDYEKFNRDLFVTRADEFQRKKKERKEEAKIRKIHRRKIMLTNEEVYEKLYKEFGGNKSAMARHYGVAETTIRKRIRNFDNEWNALAGLAW